MRKKLRRFFGGMLALSLVLSTFPTMNITAKADESTNVTSVPETDDDLYVLNYAGNNFSQIYGPYAYDKPYMYPSPHSNYLIVDENRDGVNESYWNHTGHKVMNMINTSLLKGEGDGAYASEPTYCLDAIYGEAYTHQFRRVNLEDADYFSDDEAPGRLRAILNRVFPFETDMDKLASDSNAWLEVASDSNAYSNLNEIHSLTETECITAAQSVIWYLTNGVEIYNPYLKTEDDRFSRSICLYPEFLDQQQSRYTAGNIATLVEYLKALEPEEADESLISDESILEDELIIEKEADGTYTVKFVTTVDSDVEGDTELEIIATANFANAGYRVSESKMLEDGKNDYELSITGLTHEDVVGFNAELVIQGEQQASGVFLYEPLGGREHHQTMAGYSDWTLPVRIRKEYTIDNNREIDISGSKTWVDDSNNSDSRPDSITINLMIGDTIVETKTVRGNSDVWTYTFENLPMCDENTGEEIIYTIDEVAVSGYTTIMNGYDIINTLKETESEPETTTTAPEESSSQETTTAPEESSSQETTTASETTTRVDDDDDDNEPETTPRTTAPTTTVPETSAQETTTVAPTSPTVIYRGVEIPQSILDAYPDKTLDELYDMGVLGAYFENIPTGLLPATNDMSVIWTAMSVLSAIGLAGVSVIGKKREDDEE